MLIKASLFVFLFWSEIQQNKVKNGYKGVWNHMLQKSIPDKVSQEKSNWSKKIENQYSKQKKKKK